MKLFSMSMSEEEPSSWPVDVLSQELEVGQLW